MSAKPNIKSAPGQCKLRVEETETRDAIVTDDHPMGGQRTIAYVAIGAEAWGPLLAAAPDLAEACKQAEHWLVAYSNAPDDQVQPVEMLRVLRAAIARLE
jgi:hypothetical protein